MKLNLVRGFKRLYIILVGIIEVASVPLLIDAYKNGRPGDWLFGILGMIIGPFAGYYILYYTFTLISWVIKGFRKDN